MIDSNSKTIIIRCPNWVGDLIMATPLFECLKKAYPDVKLIALTKSYNMKVIEDNPFIDEIIACQDKTVKGFLSTLREIKTLKPDLAIVLTNSFRSWFLIRLANIKNICGYKRGEHKFFVKGPVPEQDESGIIPIPMVTYYLQLLKWLGVFCKEDVSTSLFISDDLQNKGENLLRTLDIDKNDLVIGFNPGAKFGSSKCWPPEHFAKLADILKAELKCKILLLGGPGEENLASQIVEQATAEIINSASEKVDLALLKPVINRLDLLVTNDTGPRHYALAFKRPVVVLMGSTDPRYTESDFEKSKVLRLDLECSPCHKKVCPLGHHKCMRDLKPVDVMNTIKELLRN